MCPRGSFVERNVGAEVSPNVCDDAVIGHHVVTKPSVQATGGMQFRTQHMPWGSVNILPELFAWNTPVGIGVCQKHHRGCTSFSDNSIQCRRQCTAVWAVRIMCSNYRYFPAATIFVCLHELLHNEGSVVDCHAPFPASCGIGWESPPVLIVKQGRLI